MTDDELRKNVAVVAIAIHNSPGAHESLIAILWELQRRRAAAWAWAWQAAIERLARKMAAANEAGEATKTIQAHGRMWRARDKHDLALARRQAHETGEKGGGA